MGLRPFQSEALDVSLAKYQANIRRQLVALPTGTGKTPLFSKLKEHHGFSGRALVLAHREELIDQARDKILAWNPGYKVEVEMAERIASNSCDIVVGSVQTLGRAGSLRLARLDPNEFDTVICDEAHHSVADSYQSIFKHFDLLSENPRILLFGVTATPNRGDGQGLGKTYDEIIYKMSILDAIRDGWLVGVRGFRIKSDINLDGVATRAGDFAVGDLETVVNTDTRNHLIVQSWLKHSENRQSIVFCVDIMHSLKLADTFKTYGVAAEAVWGADPNRAEKLKFHREGGLKVLTNCNVLTEGYDDPSIGCVVLARPTKSQLLFVQMAGRGTRLQVGIDNLNEARLAGVPITKPDCIFLDVVDATRRHSLVTLPSLFGLPVKLDMKGQNVFTLLDKAKEIASLHPNLPMDKLETLDDIKAEVEQIDLLNYNAPEEIEASTTMRWTKTEAGEFHLSLPNKEGVVVMRDLLDKWEIKGTVNQNAFSQSGFGSSIEACKYAENCIAMFGRNVVPLVKRNAAWQKKMATDPQKKYIKFLLGRSQRPDKWKLLDMLPALTSGEARNLIDSLIKNKAN
jgi:ATP-dependent helicase IRC3